MRNGNYQNVTAISLPSSGSYRTYEEWKPMINIQVVSKFQSSYRTYEEWKRNHRYPDNFYVEEFLPYL